MAKRCGEAVQVVRTVGVKDGGEALVKALPSDASLDAKERKAGPTTVKRARRMVNPSICVGRSCRT